MLPHASKSENTGTWFQFFLRLTIAYACQYIDPQTRPPKRATLLAVLKLKSPLRQGSTQSHVTWNGWFTGCLGAIGLKICSHKYTAAKKNEGFLPTFSRRKTPSLTTCLQHDKLTHIYAEPCASMRSSTKDRLKHFQWQLAYLVYPTQNCSHGSRQVYKKGHSAKLAGAGSYQINGSPQSVFQVARNGSYNVASIVS